MDSQLTVADLYLKSLLNATYQGLHIYWTDKDNRLLLCNVSQSRSVGFSDPGELYGKTLLEIAKICHQDEEQIKKIQNNNLQIMTMREPAIFEEQCDFGGNYAVFLSYKAPFYDENGNVQGIFGISHDITEMKKARLELEKSKHATDFYLESILLSSPSNIYWLDKDGRSLGYNDQQVKHLGLKSRTQALGKTVFDVAAMMGWDPEVARKIRENDIAVMESRQPSISRETVFISGEERTYLASKSPMFDDKNEVIGILGISTDITEQAQVEKNLEIARQKAEASNRAKTQFVSNISHDIRTPLVGIQGIASWLMERVPEELQQEVQALVSASDELLILLNNVINLAKLEDDEQTEVKQEVFDLQTLINKLIVLFGPVAKQRGLILEADYAEDIPKKFISDSLLVQRSILNLVSNALKFTEQGHVIVRVQKNESALNVDEQLFPLRIIVEDTGIGIAPEAQTEIFEKFYRAWPSSQGKYRGSGLGLSIVARFVSKLGGNVEVRSVLGKGSCFMINLPLKIADDASWIVIKNPDDYASDHAVAIQNQVTPNQLKIKQVFPEGGSISRQPRILLVEDNALIQKGVTHTLNKLNCFVEIAATGTQGLEMAATRQYNLIFMDIGLPDHDGLWVSRQIRQLPHPQGQTPIIALTAHIDLKYEEVCTEAGMDKIIVKPLSSEEAQRCLDRFVLNRKMSESSTKSIT
jgi:two-component system, OmpR family, aerobic respiration control sensor histidine kinase ArcB